MLYIEDFLISQNLSCNFTNESWRKQLQYSRLILKLTNQSLLAADYPMGDNAMTTTIQVLLGIGLLIAGRRLFWLFVGAVGFVVGMALAGMFVSSDSEILQLVIALAAGTVGALLALAAQNLAVGLAGFLAGGYGVFFLLGVLDLHLGTLQWLFVILGGVFGAILVAALFEWALIILSSLTGAMLLVQAFDLNRAWQSVLIAILFVIGLAVQAGVRQHERSRAAQQAQKQAAPVVQTPENETSKK
jgi:hypothetical protein